MSTNNARIEGLAKSKLYGNALKKGQRCVVISDGFYEWKRGGATKQPYFVYAKQEDGVSFFYDSVKIFNNKIFSFKIL